MYVRVLILSLSIAKIYRNKRDTKANTESTELGGRYFNKKYIFVYILSNVTDRTEQADMNGLKFHTIYKLSCRGFSSIPFFFQTLKTEILPPPLLDSAWTPPPLDSASQRVRICGSIHAYACCLLGSAIIVYLAYFLPGCILLACWPVLYKLSQILVATAWPWDRGCW